MRRQNSTHKTVSIIPPQKLVNLEAMVQLKRLLSNKMSTWRLFRLKKTRTINSKTKYTKTIMVRILVPQPIILQELGNHLLMLRAKRIMRHLRFLHIIALILWPATMAHSLQVRILRAQLEELQRPITMHLRSLLQTRNNSSKLPSKVLNPPIGKRISMPWIL